MKKWISMFGTPKKILMNGREFQNKNMGNLTDAWHIEIMTTAAVSPFSNGRCKRAIGLIKDGLRKL